MDKKTMIKSLDETVFQFIELVKRLNKNEFEININDKWSAGQDLVHLIKVQRIVNIGFSLPKPFLRLIFGINKNDSRSFASVGVPSPYLSTATINTRRCWCFHPTTFPTTEKEVEKKKPHKSMTYKACFLISAPLKHQTCNYNAMIEYVTIRKLKG